MKIRQAVFSLVAVMSMQVAWSTGFGLYEASASSSALGGAVVGRAVDASANFFNPATLTDLSDATLTLGFVTEHPRGRMKTNIPGAPTARMDPGCFLLPHLQLAVPVMEDVVFGLGMMPEYGLGSNYTASWPLDFNSQETTVTSFTLNPNLAWRVWDGLSIGGGLRSLFFDFEQHSRPVVAQMGGRDLHFANKLKGNNGCADFGYQLGLKYDLFDDLSFGVNYKSMTRVHIKGRSMNSSETPLDSLVAAAIAASGRAHTTLDLPQSISAGLNWDITDDWHLGVAAAWTQWSTVGTLNFHLPNQVKYIRLNWNDSWRFSVAPSWDFAENWSWLASYTYETDCCGHQDSTMLPPSERHLMTTGLRWRFNDRFEFTLSYGLILMAGHDSDCTKWIGTAKGPTYRYGAHRALSHSVGCSLTYRF